MNVYIAGMFRSGSTLLTLLLSRHPQVVAAGEIELLRCRRRCPGERCSCGAAAGECPRWNEVLERYGDPEDRPFSASERGRGKRPWLERVVTNALLVAGSRATVSGWSCCSGDARACLTYGANTLALFDILREVTGRQVVVDDSKRPVRGKLLYLAAPGLYRQIHLVRDGRAACYSRLQQAVVPWDQCVGFWVSRNLGALLLAASLPFRQTLRVHYEDLCGSPHSEMERVYDFLGLAPPEDLLAFDGPAAHIVGGDDVRFSAGRVRAGSEAWRTGLTPAQLAVFERRAGWLNRALGYA
jgi:hypothetical protein